MYVTIQQKVLRTNARSKTPRLSSGMGEGFYYVYTVRCTVVDATVEIQSECFLAPEKQDSETVSPKEIMQGGSQPNHLNSFLKNGA